MCGWSCWISEPFWKVVRKRKNKKVRQKRWSEEARDPEEGSTERMPRRGLAPRGTAMDG
jgi:hypothetical protein